VVTSRGVLVTGGGSGIGLAVARAHARLGDTVVVLDRSEGDDLGDGIHRVVGDVTSPDDNERAVARVLEVAGRLDHFVGNAGIHDGGLRLAETDAATLRDVLRRVLDVDVVGYALGAHASQAALQETGGCMTFTLSDASFEVQGVGAGLAYATAKHAAVGLVRRLAVELAPAVRVNAVAPGGVITGLQAAGEGTSESPLFADPDQVRDIVHHLNPLHVMLEADELAELYLFLASPAARGMTGQVLRPDGGLSVGRG
jgi:2,3-dihydroxy-2,3-dihydrophenylpropionate dehydrogenase